MKTHKSFEESSEQNRNKLILQVVSLSIVIFGYSSILGYKHSLRFKPEIIFGTLANLPLTQNVLLNIELSGLILSSLISGYWMDKFGRKFTLSIAVIGFYVCSLAISSQLNTILLMVIQFLSGISSSLIVNIRTLSTEICPEKLKAKTIGLFTFLYTLGTITGAVLRLNWDNSPDVSLLNNEFALPIGVMGITSAAAVSFFIAETLKSKQKIVCLGNIGNKESFQQFEDEVDPDFERLFGPDEKQHLKQVCKVFTSRNLLLMLIVSVCYAIVLTITASLVLTTTRISSASGGWLVSPIATNWFFLLAAASVLLTQLLFQPKLVKKCNEHICLSIASFAATFSFGGIALSYLTLAPIKADILVVISWYLLILGFSSIQIILLSVQRLINDAVGGKIRGKVNGLVVSACELTKLIAITTASDFIREDYSNGELDSWIFRITFGLASALSFIAFACLRKLEVFEC